KTQSCHISFGKSFIGELRPDHLCTIQDVVEAKSGRLILFRKTVVVAIILDFYSKAIVLPVQYDMDTPGRRVPQRIVDDLLDNPENVQLLVFTQLKGVAVFRKLHAGNT